MNVDGIPVWKAYPYTPPPELASNEVRELQTLIVGGGPVGLSVALDLARCGHSVVLLNAMPFIARGSKAICFSKRSLDIWERLGVGERMVAKGVVWEKGKVFWKDDQDPIYEFDLLPLKDQKYPAFINLQQYYVEEYLLEALSQFDNVDIRWGNEVVAIDVEEQGVAVSVAAPDGQYELFTRYLIACDGNKSPIRTMMGLDFSGRVFEDNFLIADVKFKQQRPAERWFRFEPPYPGWSSLIHKQPDDVWRLDFQLGWDIDKTEAVKPENVAPFVRGFLGPDVEYEYEWLSIYTFQCRRMDRFVHGPVIFAGDSAHLVSPFGARGCNGGFADADNLVWKLDLILRDEAPESLLESYNLEAIVTADENILNSTRATDFLTPKTSGSKALRDAVLELSQDHAFARPFVNSGRLSTPVSYPESPLNAADSDLFDAGPAPGSPCVDAPIESENESWLLSMLGDRFCLLLFGENEQPRLELESQLKPLGVTVMQLVPTGTAQANVIVDSDGLAAERYGAADGATYLIRPDQYVAGRWQQPDLARIVAAVRRAKGGEAPWN